MSKCSNKSPLTHVLAITGTLFAWLPILLTILTSIIGTINAKVLRFDYLMPAELFPLFLLGALLLLWAAKRARSKIKPIVWGFALAALFLIGGQLIAVITGLASGAIEPVGLPMIVITTTIVLYSLSVIETGIAGILLLKHVYS